MLQTDAGICWCDTNQSGEYYVTALVADDYTQAILERIRNVVFTLTAPGPEDFDSYALQIWSAIVLTFGF
uniref:Uncharacterized protein n=1 Tax=candidate division WOR-3 bacterium TaxID=2052148 RepID=A0A7C6A956_UNCW3